MGRLIWEKQLANIQNWEKRTVETKKSYFTIKIIQKHGKLHFRSSEQLKIF